MSESLVPFLEMNRRDEQTNNIKIKIQKDATEYQLRLLIFIQLF